MAPTVSATRLAIAACLFATSAACSGTDSSGPKNTLPAVASITLTSAASTVQATHSISLAARAFDAAGNPITNASFAWASSVDTVATVDANGVVRGIAPGITAITAAADGKVATLNVTVTRAAVKTITLNISRDLVVGRSVQVQAVVIDSTGRAVVNAPLMWESSAPAITRVQPATGMLTGVAEGTARIDAKAEGITGSIQVTVRPRPPLRFTAISAHASHSCALTVEGDAFCWGRNFFNSLGAGLPFPVDDFCIGSTATRCISRPIEVADGHVFSSLSEGSSYQTCALATDGAWCWGQGAAGELGVATNHSPSAIPMKVQTSSVYTALSVGEGVTCGLSTLHLVDCWGSNGVGELGDSTVTETCPTLTGNQLCSTTPRRALTAVTFSKISVGYSSVCGLALDGTAYCWGAGTLGAAAKSLCGSVPCNKSPSAIASDLRFTDISVGNGHACAVSTSGRAYCWGENNLGQLGTGSVSTRETNPVPVNSNIAFVKIVAGLEFTCGLDGAGTAYCWGSNSYGQLGDGTTSNRPLPTPVSQGLSFNTISIGDFHSCGIAKDGYSYCWGDNSLRALGTGRDDQALTPARVAGQ